MLNLSQLNLRDHFYKDDKNFLLHLDDGIRIDSQVISCNNLFPQKYDLQKYSLCLDKKGTVRKTAVV